MILVYPTTHVVGYGIGGYCQIPIKYDKLPEIFKFDCVVEFGPVWNIYGIPGVSIPKRRCAGTVFPAPMKTSSNCLISLVGLYCSGMAVSAPFQPAAQFVELPVTIIFYVTRFIRGE